MLLPSPNGLSPPQGSKVPLSPLQQLKLCSFLPLLVLSFLLLLAYFGPETEFDPEILAMIAMEGVAPPSSPSQEMQNILAGPIAARLRNQVAVKENNEKREREILWLRKGLKQTGLTQAQEAAAARGRGRGRAGLMRPSGPVVDINGRLHGAAEGEFRGGVRKEREKPLVNRKAPVVGGKKREAVPLGKAIR